MTRFDADTAIERQELFADAIGAHRTRSSPYLTIEADPLAIEAADGLDPALGIPWMQFADGVVALDCTNAELERCKTVLEEFPAFSIAELVRPEDTAGVHARVHSNTDADRISQFIDATFVRVFGLPDDYRVWVVEV